MEVAILQPYDCLNRYHPHNHRRQLISPVKPRRNPSSPNPNPIPSRSNRRRRNSNSPPPPSNGLTNKARQTRSKSPPLMGQVRILKRGEEIQAKPQPEVQPLPSPIIDGFYAGSAFVTSPAPSEVPLPAFFTRRNCGGDAHNQEIASELRRVLKLKG